MRIVFTIFVLLYALFPRDLIPDYIFGWGWIDDLALLYLLWKYCYAPLDRRRKTAQSRPKEDSTGEAHTARGEKSRDPRAVLGVGPNATPGQIRQAYRSLAAQYHPDKVAHLGKEFRALAEKRFKEIQEAYDRIRT